MIPVPVNPTAFKGVDWVFCTHSHTDHMDPETLRLLARNPNCQFFVPCSTIEHSVETIGLDIKRTTCVNAGQSVSLDMSARLHTIPSAHEELQVNSKGEHYFLGYVFQLGDIRIYHSGDCIPYDGIQNQLKNLKPDIALLPINGRNDYRLSHNIPGNFHFEEASQLCRQTGIAYMIPHHFGMFEFNTVSLIDLEDKIARSPDQVCILLPQINIAYRFCKTD
jgi:L-ascorbate metabolism protein UlaG (beta-lactamase superfamily)